jgi:hypothetical protein
MRLKTHTILSVVCWTAAISISLAFIFIKLRNWGPSVDVPFHGDFLMYRTAARVLLVDPEKVYRTAEWPLVLNEPDVTALPFPYMPVVGLALTPFAHMPVEMAQRIWFWLTAVLLVGVAVLIARRMPLGVPRAVGLGSLFLLPAVLDTFYHGQVNVIMALLLVVSWLCIDDRRRWVRIAAGICLGVACGIKPVVAGLALVALLRRRWDFLIGAVSGWMLLLTAGLLFLPMTVTTDYIDVLLGYTGQLAPPEITDMIFWNQSLPAYWQKQFTGVAGAVLGIASVAAVLGVVVLRTLRMSRTGSAAIGEVDVAAALLGVLICAPVTWSHYILATAPVFVGIAHTWDRTKDAPWRRLLIPAGIVLMVMQRGGEPLYAMTGWPITTSLMTFGMLLWLAALLTTPAAAQDAAAAPGA